MANLRVDKITSTETFERTGSVQFDGSDQLSMLEMMILTILHDGTEAYWTIEGFIYFTQTGSYDALFGKIQNFTWILCGKDNNDPD